MPVFVVGQPKDAVEQWSQGLLQFDKEENRKKAPNGYQFFVTVKEFAKHEFCHSKVKEFLKDYPERSRATTPPPSASTLSSTTEATTAAPTEATTMTSSASEEEGALPTAQDEALLAEAVAATLPAPSMVGRQAQAVLNTPSPSLDSEPPELVTPANHPTYPYPPSSTGFDGDDDSTTSRARNTPDLPVKTPSPTLDSEPPEPVSTPSPTGFDGDDDSTMSRALNTSCWCCCSKPQGQEEGQGQGNY
jgi:hypothetical protein